MQQGLSFDQAPPLHVPLRFFLTAPLFGIAAGLLLTWQGPDALASRWTPSTLALTHLLTLGFATMVMAGALTQVLAVVAGSRIPGLVPVAALAHAGLTAGAAVLAGAFLHADPLQFIVSAVLLVPAILLFAAAAGWATLGSHGRTPTLQGIRLALLALTLTAVLGGTMTLQRGGWPVPSESPIPYHITWGLAGWIGLLLVGVAYQVVPMFQLTRPYPGWMTRHLAPALAATLAAWTVAMLVDGSAMARILAALAAFGLALFAAQTLLLQARRRRRIRDPVVLFWRIGLGSTLGATGLWAWLVSAPAIAHGPELPVLLGVLALAGAAISLICGMLYKIVPFLMWLHLQPLAGQRWRIPSLREMVPERAVMLHFWIHCGALALLVAAVPIAAMARAAGAAFALACAVLAWNLGRAALRYRALRVKLETLARLENRRLPR